MITSKAKKYSLIFTVGIAVCLTGLKIANFKSEQLPNIILISLDTLRSDSVDVYSKSKYAGNTPNIDKLAFDGVMFDHAYAPVSFTPSSHMSMFTGYYPDVHGTGMYELRKHSKGTSKETILPVKIHTLPEILSQLGYNNSGFYSCNWLKNDFGFGRGFNTQYTYVDGGGGHLFAERIKDKAIESIKNAMGGQKPFFLFLHYYDIHSDFGSDTPPYITSPDFQIENYNELAEKFCDANNNCSTRYLQRANQNGSDKVVSKDDIKILYDLYLGGVRYADQQLGELFESLKKLGIYKDALIIVTSDHGEEFWEHGRFIHSQTYEETIKVPLIIKLPHNRQAGKRIKNLVELVDIMPTVLGIIGYPLIIPVDVQGKDLTELMSEDEHKSNVAERGVFMRDKNNIAKYALRSGQYKLISDFNVGRVELYDLEEDSGEKNDISVDEEEKVKILLSMLKNKIAENNELFSLLRVDGANSTKSVLSDKEKRQLKSLGYMQ